MSHRQILKPKPSAASPYSLGCPWCDDGRKYAVADILTHLRWCTGRRDGDGAAVAARPAQQAAADQEDRRAAPGRGREERAARAEQVEQGQRALARVAEEQRLERLRILREEPAAPSAATSPTSSSSESASTATSSSSTSAAATASSSSPGI